MTVRIPIQRISLPGHLSPSAGFDVPFDMLTACHERVIRTLALLDRLRKHLKSAGCDAAAVSAAKDVMRYFDVAAPLHHEDEELHVFPTLLASDDLQLQAAVRRLQIDHQNMEVAWSEARKVLLAVSEADPASNGIFLTDADERALSTFSSLYDSHIETEESLVYPASIQRLSAEELRAMGEDMMIRREI